MNNKRMAISLIANIIAFAVNMGINFFLTPYIVNRVGSEAYGFVSLANNFTNYAMILTIALNSVAGRFITIEYENKRYNEVQRYFSSALFANVFMCVVLLIPSILCVFFLDSILSIPEKIVNDVKVLFAFIFSSFFVTLINATYSTSLFVTNRKDIEAQRNIESYILKATILIVVYIVFKPAVYYIGVSMLLTSVYLLLTNIHFTKKYLNNIHPTLHSASKEKIKILISSGIWNSLTKLSNILTDGLDLLITNLFIDSQAMGVLSIAKILPNVITTLVSTIAGVFVPNYTIAYAHNDKKEFMLKIRQSMIVSGIMSNMFLVALVVLGTDFYSLWVPSQDSNQLYKLSLLTIAGMMINGGIQCVYNIFTVVNKIKVNAIVNLVTDFGIIGTVFLLLKTTNLGIYAIAGVSSCVIILRSIFFSIPYAAYCSKIKKWFFYKQVVLNLIAFGISLIIVTFFKQHIQVDSWIKLILQAMISCVISFIVSSLMVTNKQEKKSMFLKVKKGFSYEIY